jgi:tetratricopeptide (TPR) repeat protein
LPGLILAALVARAATPEQNQLDANPALFAVMAAINAAGYDAEADSPSNNPLRETIRKEIASRHPSCLPELREFCRQHRQSDATADLSQYISWALSVNGPPFFEWKGRAADAPPDASALEGFAPLMIKFYDEAGIEELWKQAQPAFDQEIERYHEGVVQAVLQVNGFLRNETSGTTEHWFQIYIDLLAAPNQIQTRSYGRRYYVVVTPGANPRFNDIRHAYLHYLLDPLATRHQDIIMRTHGLADHAQRASALDERFKSDYLLLVTESLIQAIEARLDRKPNGPFEAMTQGYILAPYFAEELQVYLKQEQAMHYFFPQMIDSISLKREDARLAEVQFASQPAGRQAKIAHPPAAPEPKGVFKTLAQADQLYRDRDLEAARQLYLKALEESSDQPAHATAYYGLARISVFEHNPEMAERLFEKTLESKPDPQVKAWALVYLGRLEDAAGERAEATKRYKEALAVEGASEAAHTAAQQGVEQGFAKKPN